AAMGDLVLDGLRGLAQRFPFIADVRGKGLMAAVEYADRETFAPLPLEWKIGQRVLDVAYARGLIVYSRRVKGGVQGDYTMVAPPLIVTADEVSEIISILGESIEQVAHDLGLPVEG